LQKRYQRLLRICNACVDHEKQCHRLQTGVNFTLQKGLKYERYQTFCVDLIYILFLDCYWACFSIGLILGGVCSTKLFESFLLSFVSGDLCSF